MSTVYFYGPVYPYTANDFDGDWNNLNWWFLARPFSSKTTPIPEIPLGRLPLPSDDIVLNAPCTLNYPTSWNGNIAIGVYYDGNDQRVGAIGPGSQYAIAGWNTPGCVWNGNITLANEGVGSWNDGQLYNQPPYYVSRLPIIKAGTFNGAAFIDRISGGTFNMALSISHKEISGGIFNAPFTDVVFNSSGPWNISGGNYRPAATVTLTWNAGVPTVTGIIADPGFAAGGGTFAPRYTYVGFTDILGAGMI